MVAAVTLHREFSAARAPDALLCAAVGTDFGHGYRDSVMKKQVNAIYLLEKFAKLAQFAEVAESSATYATPANPANPATLLFGPQHHHEIIPLHPHIHLHLRIIFECCNDPLQFVRGKGLIAEFPPPETHDKLH